MFCILAEEQGFEPWEGYPSHAFQACRFGRSRIPPNFSIDLDALAEPVVSSRRSSFASLNTYFDTLAEPVVSSGRSSFASLNQS